MLDARERLRRHLARLKKQNVTLRAFARAHELPVQLVSQWLHGHRTPGRAYALKLQQIANIPVASWDRDKAA